MVFVVLIARALGPTQFGVYGLLLAVLEMVAVVSGSGYVDYLTREAARDRGAAWGVAAQLIMLRCGYAIAFSAVALSVLRILGVAHGLLFSAMLLFATIIPRAVSEAVQGVLRGISHYAAYLAIDVSAGMMLVAGGGVLLARGAALSTVVAVEMLAAITGCIVAICLARAFRASFSPWIAWSLVVKRSYVFNIYDLIVNLYDRLDVVLLSRLAGDYATGIYTVAYRAMNTVQIIPYGVLFSLMPSLSRGEWAQATQKQIERALGLLISVAFAAVLAVTAFATPIALLVLGPKYLESAVALKVLIWAEVLMCMNYGLNIILLARGQERVFVKTSLVCLAVNVLGNLIFIPRFSWRAAAVFTIVTELVLLVQNLYWVRRLIGHVPWPHGAGRVAFAGTVLSILIMLVPTILVQASLGAIGLALFAAYLQHSGMLTEFRRTWASKATA